MSTRGKTLDLTSMGLIAPKRKTKTPAVSLKPFEEIIKRDKYKGRKTTTKKIPNVIKLTRPKRTYKRKVPPKIAAKAPKKPPKTPTSGKSTKPKKP